MADWATLQDAYGSATDIPALIEAWTKDPSNERSTELWSRLFHQGTVYSGSFAAVPLLFQACSRLIPKHRRNALMLIGAIWASNDRFGGAKPSETAAQLVPELRAAIVAAMGDADVDEKEFLYLLQAAAAFHGDLFLGRNLDHLSDGEFHGICPECETPLYVAIGQYGYFVTAQDWTSDRAAQKAPIWPSPEEQLPPDGAWLFQQAKRFSQGAVAVGLVHIFGATDCPACGARISVAAAIRCEAGEQAPGREDVREV